MDGEPFKLSVIIPTFNNVVLFKKAINSVLSQSVKPYEVVVSDDSSTREIEEECQLLANPIVRYHRNVPSLGAVKNWNKGIERANGNWILVLHHDEEIRGNDYITQLKSLSRYSDLIISDIRVITGFKERGGRIKGFIKRIFFKAPFLNFIFNSIGPCACIAVKKKVAETFDSELTWLVDIEWYYRLLKKANNFIYYPDLVISSNHGHNDQITANINIIEKENADIRILSQKYRENFFIRIALNIRKIIRRVRG